MNLKFGNCGKELIDLCDLLNDEDLKKEIQSCNIFINFELIEKLLQKLCASLDYDDLEYVFEETEGFLYKYCNEDKKELLFSSEAYDAIDQLYDNIESAPNRIAMLYKYTPKEIQEEYEEILIEITNFYTKNCMIKDYEELLKNVSPKVQSNVFLELYDYITQMVQQKENGTLEFRRFSYFYDIRDCFKALWCGLDNEVQKQYEEYFLSILERTTEIEKMDLFAKTDSSIQKKYKDLLPDIFEQRKQASARNTARNDYIIELWKSLDEELRNENKKCVKEIFEEWLTESDNYVYMRNLWENIDQKIQEEIAPTIFSKIMEYCKASYSYHRIWNSTPDNLKKTYIESINSHQGYETYIKLKKYNSELDLTLYLPILNEEILEIFSFDALIRISNDAIVQRQICDCISNPVYKKILLYIYENNENWILEFQAILNSKKNYESLISQIEQEDLTESDVANLIHILSQEHNYFGIENIEQVRNFYNIRKETCRLILEEKLENLPEIISTMPQIMRVKFALIEEIYGIDYIEATNLVKKYGKDIENIEINPENEAVILTILGLKRILYCRDFSEPIKSLESMSSHENLISEDFEMECIHLYERLYDESLYKISEEDEIGEEEYEDTKIKIYEINPEKEFNLNVRVEGAYTDYEEPENFADMLFSAKTVSHGNCKSFVGNDCLAIAKFEGPLFGYTECKEGSLLLSAPWDIVSSEANMQFSICSTKWHYHNGIEFRIPQKQKDNTRHNHNENISERLIWDNKRHIFKKDAPKCIVYIIEPAKDEEPQDRWERVHADDRWRLSKKAAKQLEIPIVVIDRERFAEKEYQRVMELKQILLGEKENTQGIPNEVLLEKMITKFENNAVGYRFTEPNKFFSDEKRHELIESIFNKLDILENENYNEYYKFLRGAIKVLENEQRKRLSNKKQKICEYDFYKDEIEKLSLRYNEAIIKEIHTEKKEGLMGIYDEYKIDTSDVDDAGKRITGSKENADQQKTPE